MADLWRAEVNVPEVILVLPNPATGGAALTALASYEFTAVDTAGRTYNIFVQAEHHSYSGGTLFEYRTRVVTEVVSAGPTIHFSQTNFSADGASSAAYTGGGVLAIEKDGNADEVRFTTPLGTVTAVPSSWGGNDNTQMRPSTIRLREGLRVPQLSVHQNTVKWNNFWAAQNGVRYLGAAMSDDQPGTFSGFAGTAGTGTPGAVPHQTSFVQEVTRFKSEISASLGPVYTNVIEDYTNSWAGGDTIPLMTLPAIELARSDEHGIIWAAYTTSAHRERLSYRRSHDGGATWTEGVIDERAGQVVRNPNLYWSGSDLVAVWTDGGVPWQARSRSLGEHWDLEIPAGIPLLTESPRLRVVFDRHHGVAYYFAINFFGELSLVRSFDLGDTFTDEILISVSIDDAIIDAVITQDSRIHVRYKVTGAYETATSSNWGQDWTLEATAVGLGTNPRSTEDPRSGWTFHVNWVSVNTSLFGYGDPEFGLRAANFSTPAGPGLVEQVADVEMRPDGVPLIAYWAAGEVFSTRRSFDLCSTWEA